MDESRDEYWEIDAPRPPTPFDLELTRHPELRDKLGKPTGEPVLDANHLGYLAYEKGRLYRTLNSGGPSHLVSAVYNGPILDKLLALGGPNVIGGTMLDQTTTADGRGQELRFYYALGGNDALYILWSPDTGAHEVHGGIGVTWSQAGGLTGPLGYPTTDETGFGNGTGYYNRFTGGSVYWIPNIGGVTVTGDFHARHKALGYETGPLGHPIEKERQAALADAGVPSVERQRFSTGALYRSQANGVMAIHGEIYKKYAELGYESGFLGRPTSDTLTASDGVGKYVNFSNGTAIYWHPATGAHAIYGNIRARWNALGAEKSYLGYPTTDELPLPKGRRNVFQNGRIDWSNESGSTIDYKTLTMTPGSIELKNANGGRCIQVAGVGQDALRDSAATELWDCVAGAKQVWKLTPLGDNKYTLKNQNSGKCLDLPTNYNNGTSVVQYTCHGGTNQQWEFTTAANGTLALRSVYSAKIAEALSNGTANATLIGQWADLGNANQRWSTIQISTTP